MNESPRGMGGRGRRKRGVGSRRRRVVGGGRRRGVEVEKRGRGEGPKVEEEGL
jgi:hypothetical protein